MNPCPGCSLPASHCVCRDRPVLTSRCRFSVLMHADEIHSPTNTGRFVAQCLPHSRVFNWHRTEVDNRLLQRLAQPTQRSFVLFPADRTELHAREARLIDFMDAPAPHLVLLDGTWKQARKMLRKSPYLDALPLLSLSQAQSSCYTLRRGSADNQLCTLESAAALLRMKGETENADALDQFLDRFCHHYRSFKSAHLP